MMLRCSDLLVAVRRVGLLAGIALCLAAGCADNGSTPPRDTGADLPDGQTLFPCDKPGESCSAHDSCAIDPICGSDRICRPSGLQNCDDGLACTADDCLGRGACKNEPRAGSCALPVKTAKGTEIQCFKAGDKHPDKPCLVCDPTVDAKTWTGANGGACDDGNSCTKDDYCSAGQCKGTYYGDVCADELGCTDDLCDGKGGCVGNPLRADACLIQGVCYKDKEKHPSGSCVQCDASASQSDWTNIANTCHIDGVCYQVGEKHSGGCAECDPQTSTKSWTVKGNNCLVDNVCHNPGDKDAIACAQCDPASAKYAWTPIAGLCKIHGSCYAAAATHPQGCATCNPTVSATSWTVAGTGDCLINNVCLKPADKNLSGCGSCQPTQDKYSWTTLAGLCAIDGQCFSSGAAHPNSCATCNPAQSTTGWTANAGSCVIDQTCFASGAQHAAGCGSCDPSKSTTQWTVTANNCLIASTCRTSGALEPSGCGTCDPTQSQTAWTKGATCAATHAWSKRFGSTSSEYPYAVAVDSSGNVTVVGYFSNTIDLGGGALTSKGSNDIFIASFTPSGKHRWSKGFGSTSSDIAYGVAVDGGGNITVVGRFYNTITFGGATLTSKGNYDVFVASFDASGQHRWSKGFGGTSSDFAQAVSVDPNGNVYVIGQFYNTVNFGGADLTSKGSADIFVASYSTTGTHRWSKSFGGTSVDYGYSIGVDAGSNAYITGYFQSSITFGGSALTSKGSSDAFIASFTASGGHRWSKGFGNTSTDYSFGVSLDSAGNPYITGYYYTSITFGGPTLTSKGSYDAFVAAFTNAGAYRWARSFGSTSSDQGRAIATSPAGDVYSVGTFYNTVDFGGGPLTSAGSLDTYVLKISP